MNVFIQMDSQQLYWWRVEEHKSEFYQGDFADLADFYRQETQVKNWIYLLSGLDIAFRRIHFSDKERRHIRKALGFILEDDCLHDADQLHYISGKPSADAIDVVAVEKELLALRLAEFEHHGIELTHCLAETQLLPKINLAEDEWMLVYYQQQFFIAMPDQAIVSVEQEHLPLSLELLTAQYAELPSKIRLMLDEHGMEEQAQSFVPDALKHLLECQLWDKPQTWQQRFTVQARGWNFLQGSFARGKEWLSQIKPWRYVIALFAASLVLYSTLLVLDYRYEKNRQIELRQALDSEFRKVFPQGQIVDHKRQIERVLTSLRGGADQQAFIAQFADIGNVLAKHKLGMLNSVNYEADKQEIRLDLLVDSYDQLENMIVGVRDLGFEVEIQNSNAQGSQLRARIRIVK